MTTLGHHFQTTNQTYLIDYFSRKLKRKILLDNELRGYSPKLQRSSFDDLVTCSVKAQNVEILKLCTNLSELKCNVQM